MLEYTINENKFHVTQDQVDELATIMFRHFHVIATPSDSPERNGEKTTINTIEINNEIRNTINTPCPSTQPSAKPSPETLRRQTSCTVLNSCMSESSRYETSNIIDGDNEKIDFDRFSRYMTRLHPDTLNKLTLSTCRNATHSDLNTKSSLEGESYNTDDTQHSVSSITLLSESCEPRGNAELLRTMFDRIDVNSSLQNIDDDNATKDRMTTTSDRNSTIDDEHNIDPQTITIDRGCDTSNQRKTSLITEHTSHDKTTRQEVSCDVNRFQDDMDAQTEPSGSIEDNSPRKMSSETTPSSYYDRSTMESAVQHHLQMTEDYRKDEKHTEHDSKQKEDTTFERLQTYIKFEGSKAFFILVFIILNMGLFSYNFQCTFHHRHSSVMFTTITQP